MIVCKELNQSFETKELLFKALKDNKKDILAIKRAQILKSCDKDASVITKLVNTSKAIDAVKGLKRDDNYYYIAVNTTKILDSHMDLHLDGIWNKTVKEQQGKVYLVADHKLELDKVIAKKEHVEMLLVDIPFSSIGKNYSGNTQALVYKIAKDKIINKAADEWLKSGDAIEASVRMQYVNINLAMNSESKDDAEEKKNYDTHYDLIANKDEFEELNYFFTVSEAKNLKESSLVVFGSNNATGQLQDKQEPPSDTLADKAAANALQLNRMFNNLNLK